MHEHMAFRTDSFVTMKESETVAYSWDSFCADLRVLGWPLLSWVLSRMLPQVRLISGGVEMPKGIMLTKSTISCMIVP